MCGFFFSRDEYLNSNPASNAASTEVVEADPYLFKKGPDSPICSSPLSNVSSGLEDDSDDDDFTNNSGSGSCSKQVLQERNCRLHENEMGFAGIASATDSSKLVSRAKLAHITT